MEKHEKTALVMVFSVVMVLGALRLWFGGLDHFSFAFPEITVVLLILCAGKSAAALVIGLIAVVIAELAAPVCAFFRIYWPFLVLMGVKLAVRLLMLVIAFWGDGLYILSLAAHTAVFVGLLWAFLHKPERAGFGGENAISTSEPPCQISQSDV